MSRLYLSENIELTPPVPADAPLELVRLPTRFLFASRLPTDPSSPAEGFPEPQRYLRKEAEEEYLGESSHHRLFLSQAQAVPCRPGVMYVSRLFVSSLSDRCSCGPSLPSFAGSSKMGRLPAMGRERKRHRRGYSCSPLFSFPEEEWGPGGPPALDARRASQEDCWMDLDDVQLHKCLPRDRKSVV